MIRVLSEAQQRTHPLHHSIASYLMITDLSHLQCQSPDSDIGTAFFMPLLSSQTTHTPANHHSGVSLEILQVSERSQRLSVADAALRSRLQELEREVGARCQSQYTFGRP